MFQAFYEYMYLTICSHSLPYQVLPSSSPVNRFLALPSLVGSFTRNNLTFNVSGAAPSGMLWAGVMPERAFFQGGWSYGTSAAEINVLQLRVLTSACAGQDITGFVGGPGCRAVKMAIGNAPVIVRFTDCGLELVILL